MAKIQGKWCDKSIYLNDRPLSPDYSRLYRDLCPGFLWGDEEAGSRQLALAVLLVYVTSDKALALYKDFAREWLAPLEHDDFTIFVDVLGWVRGKLEVLSQRGHTETAPKV